MMLRLRAWGLMRSQVLLVSRPSTLMGTLCVHETEGTIRGWLHDATSLVTIEYMPPNELSGFVRRSAIAARMVMYVSFLPDLP